MFITFEGIDGCGKSTQAKRLADNLREMGHEVVLTREPGGTRIAEEIRNILLYIHEDIHPMTETFLYEASRNEHVEKIILPALKEGKTVISDRFYDSTIAYQGAGRGLGIAAMEDLNRVFREKCPPDLTIFVDTPVEVVEARMSDKEKDRMEKEGTLFMEKVRQGYLEIIERDKERFFVISGCGTIDEGERKIFEFVKRKLLDD